MAKVDWDAAMVTTARYLPTVQNAITEWLFKHPEWWVRASVETYPPHIHISAFLVAPEKTRRVVTGVNTGLTAGEPNYVGALTPTDDELCVIGDFVGGLATPEFKPERMRYQELPWVEYRLTVDFGKYRKDK